MKDPHAFSSHPGHGSAELTVAAAETPSADQTRITFPDQADHERQDQYARDEVTFE